MIACNAMCVTHRAARQQPDGLVAADGVGVVQRGSAVLGTRKPSAQYRRPDLQPVDRAKRRRTLFFVLNSAPCFTSSAAAAGWPNRATRMSAVQPY